MDKKLVRLSGDRMVAGVCSGLAQYFNIDPTIVRLLFVVATLFNGAGLLAYIIMWIVLPEGVRSLPSAPQTPQQLTQDQDPTGEWQFDPYTGERIKK